MQKRSYRKPKSVFEWVTAVTGIKQKELPAFIFIDELDRCRPSYAVEMLETIKHIFDISGVVFVVATDTEQLQHAVKVVYGEDLMPIFILVASLIVAIV